MAREQIDRNRYDYLRSKLVTKTPQQLEEEGVVSRSCAYKILQSRNYDDYRQKRKEEKQKAYARRVGNSKNPIPIKKNVPPLGTGSFRFTPPSRPIDGGTIYGSPFRSTEGNGGVKTIEPQTRTTGDAIDLSAGPIAELRKPIQKTEATGDEGPIAHNRKMSVARDGVDAFRVVTVIPQRGKKPRMFSMEVADKVATLMKNGAMAIEITDYLMEEDNRHTDINSVFRIAAYEPIQLGMFKTAWKQGETERIRRIAEAREKGVEKGVEANKKRFAEAKAAGVSQRRKEERTQEAPEAKKELRQSISTVEGTNVPDISESLHEHNSRVKTVEVPAPKEREVVSKALQSEPVYTRVKYTSKHIAKSLWFCIGANFTTLVFKLLQDDLLDWWAVFIPAYCYLGYLVLTCSAVGARAIWEYNKKLKEELND